MDKPKESVPNGSSSLAERKTQPRRSGLDIRGMLSLVTLLGSLSGLTIAMGGAAKMVWDMFREGFSLDGAFAKMIVLGLAYLFGWVMGLVCIRGFGNLVYPIVIKIYAVVTLVAISALYLKIIQKLLMQDYNFTKFWVYLFMLLGGLVVLIGLHLLIENHDLRPFSIPLLIISVLQLFVIVFRYVFTTGAKAVYLWGDLTIFFTMLLISALMLMHLGVLSSLRAGIDQWFSKNGNGAEINKDQHWVR